MKEIGSEFWTTESTKSQELFFVSGRTALDFIIRDILLTSSVGKVFLPSYCCHSMIEPFLSNGLSVSFYEIRCDKNGLSADIPPLKPEDIFFYMDFFGFESPDFIDISQIRNSGCTIIKDATHSWLTDINKKKDDFADYTFISYRKWTGLTGIATAKKNNKNFIIPQENLFHHKYEQLRLLAQNKKKQYMDENQDTKQAFLSAFSEAEELLDEDYANYLPTTESISALLNLNKSQIATARPQNADFLLCGLQNIPKVTPLFPKLDKNLVPLCVPIMVDPSLRDQLRKHLIDQKIYCPVHWPLSDLHKGISQNTINIYNSE